MWTQSSTLESVAVWTRSSTLGSRSATEGGRPSVDAEEACKTALLRERVSAACAARRAVEPPGIGEPPEGGSLSRLDEIAGLDEIANGGELTISDCGAPGEGIISTCVGLPGLTISDCTAPESRWTIPGGEGVAAVEWIVRGCRGDEDGPTVSSRGVAPEARAISVRAAAFGGLAVQEGASTAVVGS